MKKNSIFLILLLTIAIALNFAFKGKHASAETAVESAPSQSVKLKRLKDSRPLPVEPKTISDIVKEVTPDQGHSPPDTLTRLMESHQSSPNKLARDELLHQFSLWAADSSASQEALNYALTSLDGVLRLDAATAVIEAWAKQDIRGVATYLATLLTPDLDYFIYRVANHYARHETKEAMEWALQGIPMEYRRGAAQHVMIEWAQSDSRAATDWVIDVGEDLSPASMASRKATWEAFLWLARADIQEALNKTVKIQNIDLYSASVNATMYEWVELDPLAAGRWLDQTLQNNPDANFDESLALHARLASQGGLHEDANYWISQIQDEELRETTQAAATANQDQETPPQ